ncbi:MAG: DUF2911 domain-containing protein [Saprospiraceae bacterium]|nr:DUF2911 domain-containing protein [Saprospiraceae bacterium]
MKKMLLLSFALLATTFIFAQNAPKAQASPAAKAEGKIGDSDITIGYNQPAVKGRKIWGSLVPFGEVWRTGANGATTITLSKDLTIDGKTLPAGRYGLFTIPTETEWTVIFNSNADQWGAYDYSNKKDVLRVKAQSAKSETFNERMTFAVKDNNIVLMWENLVVTLEVK